MNIHSVYGQSFMLLDEKGLRYCFFFLSDSRLLFDINIRSLVYLTLTKLGNILELGKKKGCSDKSRTTLECTSTFVINRKFVLVIHS